MTIRYHRGLSGLTIWEDGDSRHIQPEFRGLMRLAVWVCERVSKAVRRRT